MRHLNSYLENVLEHTISCITSTNTRANLSLSSPVSSANLNTSSVALTPIFANFSDMYLYFLHPSSNPPIFRFKAL